MAPFTLALVLLLGLSGDQQGKNVAQLQPAKLAALESHWETGRSVPFYLLTWPDENNEGNKVQAIGIPGLLSWIAYGNTDAEVKGLKDFAKQDRPPVLPTFLTFRAMCGFSVPDCRAAQWPRLQKAYPQRVKSQRRRAGLAPWDRRTRGGCGAGALAIHSY